MSVPPVADKLPLPASRGGSDVTPDLPPEDRAAPPWREDEAGGGLVGSLFWELRQGDRWVLGPESAFLYRSCWRKALVREAYMLERPRTLPQRFAEAMRTLGRRWITGEPFLLDLYTAEADDAELGISSDEIGGNLYAVAVSRQPLLCRKGVYFGSQVGLRLRVGSPLGDAQTAGSWLELLKRTVYGPGWVFQRFDCIAPDESQIILQIDGDPYFRELAPGESVRADPRHAYAWDESVSWRLVKFGSIRDRLLRGSVPFQVEFQGPGRIWLSNMSFGDGYLGSLFTPSHWLFVAVQRVRRLLGILNPANWV